MIGAPPRFASRAECLSESGTEKPSLDDALSLYLDEIRGHHLLSALEEHQLARQIALGKKEQERPEVIRNQAIIDDGIAAKRRLIESNLRLVTSLIRLPVWVREALTRLKHERVRVEISGEEVSIARLAANLGMTPEKVEELLAADRLCKGMVSLEAPLGEYGEMNLVEVLEDQSSAFIESTCSSLDHREQLVVALHTLSPRQRAIVEMRYGLDGDGGATLFECGERFGISRERIRQIEAVALEREKANGKDER